MNLAKSLRSLLKLPLSVIDSSKNLAPALLKQHKTLFNKLTHLKDNLTLCVLIMVSLSSPIIAKAQAQPELSAIEAVKIFVPSAEMARKIAISYHHGILETNYKDGYIIADLSSAEVEKLRELGLKVELASQWNQRYLSFKKTIEAQLELKAKGVKLAGIPGYPCYPTVEETLATGNNLAIAYPNLTEWIDIGDSWKKANTGAGYNLMVLKITNKQIVANKPKLFIHSSMHAREYTPAALSLDFAKLLLQEYATNADIQWIVDYHEVHILFHMNPDGRKIAETGLLHRKNTNANHCAGGSVGVDLNRNFAFFWNTTPDGSSGDDCSEVYRGSAPESEPETQAVSNYIRSLFPDARGPNDSDAAPQDTPGMHIDIHSYSELVLWPWGHKSTPPPNSRGLIALGNKFAWFNNYTPQQSVALYPTDGTSDDISYGELGIAAFTFELGTNFFQQCTTYTSQIKPDNLKALVYAAKAVAAPYLLSLGPDVTSVKLNDADNYVAVTQGSPIDLKVTASAIQTRLSVLGKNVASTRYSIDTPIWQASAQIVNMNAEDGTPTSGIENFVAQIDTTNLSAGEHRLYLQSSDAAGNLGVVTVASFDIAQNNSPIPSFVETCSNLVCNFDATASSDPDGSISQYSWDFNGEASATGATVSYTFAAAGSKQVTLTVTDDTNNQASSIHTFNVDAPPAPPPPKPPRPSVSSSGGGSTSLLGLLSILLISLIRKRNAKAIR